MCFVRLGFFTMVSVFGIMSVGSDNPLDAACEALVTCDSSPCSCDEADLNCASCNQGSGCGQCSNNYFAKTYDHKCIPCSDIPGCKHCTSGGNCQNCGGCQQCDDGCERVFNSNCNLYVCNCGDTVLTPSPTINPTNAPISDEAKIYGATSKAEDFLEGTDCDSFLNEFNSASSEICITEVDCYNLANASEKQDYVDKFCGICDLGVLTYISDFVSADLDGKTYFSPTFWRACHNSIIGQFWLNFVAIVVADENTLLYDKLVYNFRDEDEVVENLNAIWSS